MIDSVRPCWRRFRMAVIQFDEPTPPGNTCTAAPQQEQWAAGPTTSWPLLQGANAMELGLHGKHAVVTGGSRGIGKAIARELARGGGGGGIVARKQAGLA